ncbi:MAG: TatD family hydrolase [Campylobacteraceae bacterium]|jgi:TatD DNase family protein|nr:TatD family hydrolase [Campylobacteraceae bacterium]
MIIDTHCHLDDGRFEGDLDDVVKRAKNAEVSGILIPGADIFDLPKAKEISYKYDNIFYAAGVHPYHHKDYNESILEEYLQDWRCIAVGECGLDYFRLPKNEEEKTKEKVAQKEVFIAQIKLAAKFAKPLIVHVRDANEDSFDILNEYAVSTGVTGVLHCYNASTLLLKLRENFYFALGGVLTFQNAKNLTEILPEIPKERLLFETDAPYLTPHPHRGERNEPAYTRYVVQKAGEILNISVEELSKLSSNNAKRIFKAFNKANSDRIMG